MKICIIKSLLWRLWRPRLLLLKTWYLNSSCRVTLSHILLDNNVLLGVKRKLGSAPPVFRIWSKLVRMTLNKIGSCRGRLFSQSPVKFVMENIGRIKIDVDTLNLIIIGEKIRIIHLLHIPIYPCFTDNFIQKPIFGCSGR